MIFLKSIYKYLVLQLSLLIFSVGVWAGNPVVKIDFNQSGRNIAQVNEIGYESWNTYGETVSKNIDGLTFTLTGKGPGVTGLKSHWYKAGIGNAKLANDGVTLENGNNGGEISLTIGGLAPGVHSLLVFLNHVDSPESNTFCPVDILVNGELAAGNVIPSVRVASNYEAKIVYLKFTATKGEDTKVVFKSDIASDATNKNIMINGIELDTPNVLEQAINPFPKNGDEHVDVAEKNLELSWTANRNAISHHVYFSENEVEVNDGDANADKGIQINTVFYVENLNSHASYFWRVDEIKADGTVTKGDVWMFRIAQLAFPGAEGYGRFARGGRDGKVIHVTNLNDGGEGSFRYAIENEKGPRTIVFDISGLITLKSRLVLSDSYVTIAGQTAPGKGICLRDAPFGLSGANDVIVQNIRVRRGNIGDYNFGLDGMGMQGSNNCIIDHCSISWTIDEAFSSRSAKDISLQRTLISEALNVAGHPNYPEGTAHGYAGSIGGDVGSFHHNLLAHCEGRNWSLAGGLDGNAYYSGRLDIRNNVVYNWGHRATDGGAMQVNFVGNYYKPGAATNFLWALNMQHEGVGLGSQRAYFAGNVMPGYFDETNEESGRKYTISNHAVVDWKTFVDQPFFASHVKTESAIAAYKDVLSDVGCNEPTLDDHDKRVINETLTGTYSITGSKSGKPGLPDDQEDVGGWENYPEVRRETSWDSDQDGLPDWWENNHKLDPNSAVGDFSDANQDLDNDGYTELEDYLQWMSKTHFFSAVNEPISVDLGEFFKGYQDHPAYDVVRTDNGNVEISDGIAVIKGASNGMASFSFKVTDAEGDSKVKEVVALFTPNVKEK